MKTLSLNLRGVRAAVPAALLAALLAATAVTAAALSPPLAPGVVPQGGYETLTTNLYVANPTPIFSNILWTSPALGRLDEVGQKVEVLAKVRDWDWVLVGRNGVGIGYIPRDLLTATPPAGRVRRG